MRRTDPDHPAGFGLSQFVDGELDPLRREEIARHIEACDGCRAEVRFFEELREATRGIEFERLSPPDVADAVIRRRRAGERGHPAGVVAPVIAASRRRYGEVAAAALVGVVALSAYLLLAPTAAATRGELSFGAVPSVPGAVPVDYQPAYYLADEDSLRLRARIYAASGVDRGSRDGTIRETTLRRKADGAFTGRLPLREGDVFAAAAVEDFEGVDLDMNFGRLWELYVALEEGEPSFTALESHYRALESYNPFLAGEWAEQLAATYPENPLGWAVSYWNLSTLRADPVPDSVRSFHRRKLDELIRVAGAETPPAKLLWLSAYARYLGEPVLQDSLFRKLALLAPDHPAILDRRVFEIVHETEPGSPDRAARLERLWQDTRHPSAYLVHVGVQTVAAAGQEEATSAWLDRGLQHDEVGVGSLVTEIAPYPAFSGERLRLLRWQLAHADSPTQDERPLRSSAPEFSAERRNEIISVKIALADALADTGNEAAAAELFQEAADQAWRSDDLRPYVDFLLARGDSVTAIPILGMLTADPISGQGARVAYSEVIGTHTDNLESFTARSRAELARRIRTSLAAGRGSRLRDDTRMTLLPNADTTAGAYFAGRPSVLLFWDSRLDPEFGGLASFDDLASREWAADIQTGIVLSEPIESDTFTVGTGRLPVLVDPEQELRRQIREFALPLFVVLDPQLGIVVTSHDATLAFRVAESLTWLTGT